MLVVAKKRQLVHKLDSPVITMRHCAVFLNAARDLDCFCAFANTIIPEKLKTRIVTQRVEVIALEIGR
jgi:hypothetical protein